MVIVFPGIVILSMRAPKLRMPVMVLELIFGKWIGRSLLNLVPESQIIDFFSDFGLVLLMFLAGMEIDRDRATASVAA
jgi:Kef-type K+ transport system membrane component KefB